MHCRAHTPILHAYCTGRWNRCTEQREIVTEISGKYIIFEIPKGVQSSAFSYSHLKEPFRIPSAPALVLRDMVAQGDNSKTVELKIDMTFTADDLERYDALNSTPELWKGCKSSFYANAGTSCSGPSISACL